MSVEYEREQNEKIEQFFGEYYQERKWDKQANAVVGGIFAFLVIVLMILPIQELWQDEARSAFLYLISLFGVLAALYGQQSYRAFKEKQQMCLFSQKLKYLPVDRKVLKKWKTRMLIRWTAKMFAAALMIQLLFAAIIVHGISWRNVVYVMVVAFILPILCNSLLIWVEK